MLVLFAGIAKDTLEDITREASPHQGVRHDTPIRRQLEGRRATS